MKTRLMAMMLMAGGAMFAQTHFSIGVRIGAPAPAVVPVAVNPYRPPCPGPGYIWIDGYYDEFGNWFDGYWALPPYVGAYWVAPRFVEGHLYAGYWGGPRGVFRPEPRVAPRGFAPGRERAFDRPMPERTSGGFREHGNAPDRGPARGGEFRQGYRR